MARSIDSEVAYQFLTEQLVKETGAFSKGVNKGLNIARSAMRNPDAVPTLTPPNEPLTLEELKAEAKRQGYKLIKAKKPRFERCLCGHNVHQWCSGPEGWMVYCKHCGLESPWVRGGDDKVIEAWNAMILEKRKERSHEHDERRSDYKS